jgi:hypothetical protein
MNHFQESLKRQFQELYTRKNVGKDLLTRATNPTHIMDIRQNMTINDMKIEQGLKFLEQNPVT